MDDDGDGATAWMGDAEMAASVMKGMGATLGGGVSGGSRIQVGSTATMGELGNGGGNKNEISFSRPEIFHPGQHNISAVHPPSLHFHGRWIDLEDAGRYTALLD